MAGRHEFTDQEVTWICESLASRPVLPQLLVSMGPKSFLRVSELADQLAMPWCACVTAPITWNGRCIGVVSGTNDHAYVDPVARVACGVTTEELNNLMQAARIEAVSQAAGVYRRRVNPVCPTLENTGVVLLGAEDAGVPLEYLVRLVRKKAPHSITVLARLSPHLKELHDSGEFETLIVLPEGDAVSQVM